MLIFWLAILLGFIFINRVQKLRVESIALECQYSLYRLRDELREHVIIGDIDEKNWVFQYLDSSFAKTITVLPSLSLWRISPVALLYRRNARLKRAIFHLEQELKKTNNKILADLHDQYALEIGQYLLRRHFIFKIILINAILAVIAAKFIRDKWDKLVSYQTEVPETSTLLDYAPGR